MSKRDVIIKDTHRGLLYRDGVLQEVLGAGRYRIPRAINLGFYRAPRVEVALVDMRERDVTIKGQEILTADKVAIRVSIVVRFRVLDPKAALHEVESFEDRLYTDVQLAARRSLAAMALESILTNRNQLSDDILREVKETAGRYGVDILRADVKDLVFPGNLQEIMNRVLAAERTSQAQLVEARTKAQTEEIAAQARARNQRIEAEARAESERLQASSDADVARIKTEAGLRALQEREKAVQAYEKHPALMRLEELEALRDLARNANARIRVGFERPAPAEPAPHRPEPPRPAAPPPPPPRKRRR
jgi:regulator of protease activity HflC (stomatin/prohibitin superfamily)